MKKTTLCGALCVVAALCASGAARIAVDFDTETGPVKPVHGTGQGPLLGWCDFSLFGYLKDAGIPYARLHDVGGPFGKNIYVDIPNIFRDFEADENDPKSYDFTYTDLYLNALVANGVEPYFRLGVTIENSVRQTKKAYRLHPPKDFAKWARICEHVVRHYTEGWADGFRHKITYWEIWNEPDDFPDYRNAMWYGTWRQYCELYEAASKHLKACFPGLKIGGYGRCTAHGVTARCEGRPIPENEVYREKCFEEFCAFVRERRCPLDFFSFHGYIPPEMVGPHADFHRKALDAIGYTRTELHLNEWACGGPRREDWWQTPSVSSKIAAYLVALQASAADAAMVYDARCQVSRYSLLFDPIRNRPAKPYWAFRAFNTLYRLGREVKVSLPGGQGADGLWAVAAKGEAGGAVMIVNDRKEARALELDAGGRAVASCRITDAGRNEEVCALPGELPPESVLLVLFGTASIRPVDGDRRDGSVRRPPAPTTSNRSATSPT